MTKVDSRRFAAFCSPNLPPLAVVGADVIRKLGGEQGHPVRAPARGFMPGAGRETVSGGPRESPCCPGLQSRGPLREGACVGHQGGSAGGEPQLGAGG